MIARAALFAGFCSPEARASAGRAGGLVAALVLAPACDKAGEVPSKSRVQAVLAEPGSAPEPEVAVKAEPAARPAQPRAPLCDGQLANKPRPFEPKRRPSQLSVHEEAPLPTDPLGQSGGRWTWVNFWAAWCVPCKQELPLLFSWQEKLRERLAFRFVSFDDDERQLRDFLAQQPSTGLKSSYWLPDGPTRQAWLEALSLTTEPELPLQLLLDPKGRVQCRVQGAVEPQDLAALEAIVRGRAP